MRVHPPFPLWLGAILLAIPVTAAATQEPGGRMAPTTVDTTNRRQFDIPTQPLADALDAFRQQSSLSVEVDTTLASGVQSYPVSGTHTAGEALRLLLTGTGFVASFRDDRTIVVRRNAAPAPQTLRAVKVVATRPAEYALSQTATATKTPTPLRDVPQSVSVITRDLIDDLSMQSIADVVRFVPGVTMGQGEGNRDQPTIRGNNTTADFFVDGVRDDVQYFRDLYNVERVEALKGSNAMIFGRGGGGGVLNRVTKEATGPRLRALTLQGGSFDNKRASIDLGDRLSSAVAARFNGVVERSGHFRDGVTLQRYGVNPTVAIAPGAQGARILLGYEHFVERRTADRGIPSFNGRPIVTDVATFFGDPGASFSDVRAHVGTVTLTHRMASGLSVRNRSQVGLYDKFYQNVFPGAVNAAGDQVTITAYNNDTQRQNLFNQTDLTIDVRTGPVRHTLLLGAEVGRQATDNLRLIGYFNDVATSVTAPVADPTISVPVTFRPGASDADNRVVNTVGSVYVQDQLALSAHWQLIAGARYERFDLRYRNNRTSTALRRTDGMISPRIGLVFKPMPTLSLYTSHGVSYLPSAGDQFSSLTDVTKALEPERFTNYEAGAKWDVADRLAIAAAAYRLDRTNTRAPDPVDPARTVQTGSQRTTGVELTVNGSITAAWQVVAAYSNQRATITSTTAAAPTGAKVPLVPRNGLSLWNRYQLGRRMGVGLGVVHRADMFAALDDKVTLPAYTDVDGALYLGLGHGVRAQVYVENLFDTTYYSTAHNNNNITPGSRRALRVSLTTDF